MPDLTIEPQMTACQADVLNTCLSGYNVQQYHAHVRNGTSGSNVMYSVIHKSQGHKTHVAILFVILCDKFHTSY